MQNRIHLLLVNLANFNVSKNEWVEQALDDDFGSVESFDDDDYRGNFF